MCIQDCLTCAFLYAVPIMSNVRIMGPVITEPLLFSRVMDRKPGVAVRDGVTLSASPPTELSEDGSTVDDAVCPPTDDKLSVALA